MSKKVATKSDGATVLLHISPKDELVQRCIRLEGVTKAKVFEHAERAAVLLGVDFRAITVRT